MYYLFNFILYSIFGYFFEIFYKAIFNHKVYSSILYGPYTMIYGFGIILLFYIFEKYNIEKIIKQLLIAFLLLSIIEGFSGYLIKWLFHTNYWNYSDKTLHIGKYISFEMSFLWSLGIIIIYKYIKPLTDKLFVKTNKNIIIICFIIMFIDFIMTFLNKVIF